ncbi:MAG: NUDIX hydrolase [Gammaproteobacteria bacterium]|nr:NUDIX hydrolase [Gammaproteobacteria bacterium]
MSRPETPLLTVDIIIEMQEHPGKIVLIERRHEPLGWALPGGFVDVGESVEEAAVREAYEETGLRVRLMTLLGIYSDPSRDPRGHNASAVFVAEAWGMASAGDDAANAGLFSPDGLPPLAFDHGEILADYRHFLATGEVRHFDSPMPPGKRGA